jgi:hypothetical protein
MIPALYIYILRNNSRTQVQSEKIAISSLSVNDREPCSVAHNTRVYTKKVFNNFRNLSIFHFVILIQLLIPLGLTHFLFKLFLFITGLSCPRVVQTSLTQNCLTTSFLYLVVTLALKKSLGQALVWNHA